MAQLAIKGHPTRGSEVIKILKMLGGQNYSQNLLGGTEYNYYYIGNYSTISCIPKEKIDSSFIKFTLEEFLEKFPYKVGDKVLYKYDNTTYFIRKMFWENDKVLYELSDEVYSDGCSIPDTLIFNVDAVKLQPCKEETMEKKIKQKND